MAWPSSSNDEGVRTAQLVDNAGFAASTGSDEEADVIADTQVVDTGLGDASESRLERPPSHRRTDRTEGRAQRGR